MNSLTSAPSVMLDGSRRKLNSALQERSLDAKFTVLNVWFSLVNISTYSFILLAIIVTRM